MLMELYQTSSQAQGSRLKAQSSSKTFDQLLEDLA
jgi:hypothetical protein